MADIKQDLEALIGTLRELFGHDNSSPEFEILSSAEARIEQIGYDNWDGGTDIYGLYLEVPIKLYATYEPQLKTIEDSISDKFSPILRKYPNTWIGEVVVSPRLISPQEPQGQATFRISNKDLMDILDAQRNLMIAVSTGGPRIQNVNDDYKQRQQLIEDGLSERGVENPNPYSDLWEWYGKWSSGDLPSYQSRRNYINGLFGQVVKQVRQGVHRGEQAMFTRATGWPRVDRNIGEVRTRLAQAKTEEQFQAVGFLCRETMISLGQAVYNPETHPSPDGVTPSKTDAKRMLDAYLGAKLSGKTNETGRRHAKAALEFAHELTHKRTANFRQAAMCAEATTAVVNIVAIVSGQRDPME
jgi:hypothetical protein